MRLIRHSIKLLFLIFIISIIAYFVGIYILKTFVFPLHNFEIVKEEASKNGLDPYLIMAIIKTESGFNTNATSSKEARGLMQIMDSTAKDVNNSINLVDDIDTSNIYDANINIALGCSYFAKLLSKYNGNYYLAICAYNAGMGNVDKWIESNIVSSTLAECDNVDIPFGETKNYLKKVIKTYSMYRFLNK